VKYLIVIYVVERAAPVPDAATGYVQVRPVLDLGRLQG
jgi:hypothetical protein